MTFSLVANITTWDEDSYGFRKTQFPKHVDGNLGFCSTVVLLQTPYIKAIGDHFLLKGVKNKIDYLDFMGLRLCIISLI